VTNGDLVEQRVGERVGEPGGVPLRPHPQPSTSNRCVADGRVVEHWGVPDRLAVLVQTGALGGAPA
jgi:hypothetical protein